MTEALAIRDDEPTELAPISPREVIRAANEQANALAEVIESKKLYVNIGGKKYVKCEGWTTLAILRGYAPSEESVVEVDGVYTATVVLHRIRDGMVLTRASAECGSPDEPMWANRPRYARRSMAITRATSKACRVAFSWALALAGKYEVTPAEEVPEGGFHDTPPVQRPNADYPRERQTVNEDGGTWTGTIAKVRQVTGKMKNGQEWVLNVVEGGDGTEFGTFDTGLADMARSAGGGANRVTITWEKSKKGGRNIVRIEDAEGVFDE